MSEEYNEEFNQEFGNGGATKRPAEEAATEHPAPPKRFCQGEGPTVELRVLIQSKNAGAIIGKAGANIKRLRNTYNASVTVPDSNGPERILSIQAPLGTVLECLREAIPSFEDYQHYQIEDDFECDLHLLVHQSQAGCVIGRGGMKIKELREMTGAGIKVYTDCCPRSTDRVIQVSGPISKVISAIGEIYDLLQSAPPKGAVNNYNADFAEEFTAHSYGGFTMGSGGRSGARAAGRGAGTAGFGTGRGAAAAGGAPGVVTPLHSARPGYGGGGEEGFDQGFDRSRGGFGQGGPRDRGFGAGYDANYAGGYSAPEGAHTKTQVSIPKDLAGAIIGKGGSRIKQIRTQSNAKIQIDEAVAGSNDRIITISGTHDQIQNAQYLLQLSVKQHQGGAGGGDATTGY